MAVNGAPAIFLMGPTASGKTDVATRLYELMDCELVSVDSAQVFRGMNIGTAKPDHDFLQKFPHHLIDIRDIESNYSAAEFRSDALELIGAIAGRGRVPVLVGGTMFYFSALENGISSLPSSSPETRKSLERELLIKGNKVMHAELEKIDPVSANRIRQGDSQRLQRAFEIYRITGKPPSEVMANNWLPGIGNQCVKIALCCGNRSQLHTRISSRFGQMIEQGLVNEVQELVGNIDQPGSLASMRCVGYRQVLGYLQGLFGHEEMVKRGIAATRQLAKRQLTWLRNQSNVTWFDAGNAATLDAFPDYFESHPGFNLKAQETRMS